MATSLKVNKLSFVFDGSYRATNDYGSKAAKFDHDWAIALTNGTGSGNANFAYQDQLTINASSSQTIDLNSLTDEFGSPIAPSKIKLLAIRLNSSTDTAASLNVGAAASNKFSPMFADPSDIAVVRYQGWMIFACLDATGYAVDATHKDLKIANNSASNSAVVDLVVIGVK